MTADALLGAQLTGECRQAAEGGDLGKPVAVEVDAAPGAVPAGGGSSSSTVPKR